MSSQTFPLDVKTALQLNGAWTDVTTYTYNRSSPAFTITSGRPDETSTVSPSVMTGQLNNRDGRFTSRNPTGPYYPYLTRNTPVRLSVPDTGTYLRFADDAFSTSTTPDSTALRVTGSIDIFIDMNLDDYQTCILACKWGSTGQAWAVFLNSDGTITLSWFDGSSTQFARSTASLPNLGRIMVRCTLNTTTGNTVFNTASSIGGSQTQLGATVAFGAATVISGGNGQAVVVGARASPFQNGLLGKVYEFALYNGIVGSGGTLVADPQFYAQTAGATSFTDGPGNTWTFTGTAELSNRSYRFHGEMSSLPVAWNTKGSDIWVPFQAGGILRRLGQGSSPLPSPMKRGILSQPLAVDGTQGGTVAYWPCEDGLASTQIAPGMAGVLPMTIAGVPTFTATTGTPTTDSTFDCSASLPQVQSSTWIATVPLQDQTYFTESTVNFLLCIPAAGLPNCAIMGFVLGGNGLSPTTVLLTYQAAAGGSLDITSPSGITGPTGINGVPLWIQIDNVGTGADVYFSWLEPGNTVQTTGAAGVSDDGSITSILINPDGEALGETILGHLWVTTWVSTSTVSSSPTLSSLNAVLSAHNNETAGNRFARLCSENSINSRIYGFPAQSVMMGPQDIDTLPNLLQECETADNGIMYEPREALGLGYRTSAALCNQAAAVVLDYSLAQVGDQEGSPVSLTSIDDDRYTRNDVTATRTSGTIDGSSYQVTLNDGSVMSISSPPAGIGDYSNSVSVNVASDAQLPDAAGWLVHIGTVLEERYPQIVTGLHRPPIINASLGFTIQAARTGDYVQIINPPSWLPPGTIKQLIVGVTEALSRTLYQVSWNAVPESPYETGIYDDVVYGHYDTDGSTLNGGVSSGAVTLSVATTNAASPLWTTAGSDCPFDISIGGEQITVTAITGSSSPQSFTVTRSVNGVVKTQASGADVRLFHPAIYALD